jgi:8-oxo-dGTP diphosphatase
MDIKEFLEKGGDYYLPNLSIDLIIIGYKEDELKCLLLKIGEKWLLPGGHIRIDESVPDAVKRVLIGRTNLEFPHLKFLSVFGDKNRQFTDEWRGFCEKSGFPWKNDYWLNNRFVTLAYYALVNIENTIPVVGEYDEAFSWFSFDELPSMWMDHKSIVREARNRLKEDILHEQVTYNLLSDHFTMPELHALHQTILEKKLDRSRFQKKMLSSGMFERLPKRQKESPGRNPYQYRIKKDEN